MKKGTISRPIFHIILMSKDFCLLIISQHLHSLCQITKAKVKGIKGFPTLWKPISMNLVDFIFVVEENII